ncbi:hypothetical protein [Halorussus caseinilyticus]|uniref:Twin-arginine translocation signal domain-containing protein n=1 Tax=Halorussus caseinilyticus TaxID=3034025 RepID=A0ABD5WPK4_9EURY|nr:hypothetical protein [Halorussus sp. DT72]
MGETDESEIDLDRRSFLKRSAVGAFGLSGVAAQQEPNRFRSTRRIAFEEPSGLSDDWRQRIILLTDRTDDDPDVSEVDACAFSNWPTEKMTIWEGIVVDVKDLGDVAGFFGSNPTVRAEKLVERNRIFVDEQQTPVPLGTPLVVSGVVDCPEKYLGVLATQIPGIRIKTGPGVSTGEATN